jgi:NAD(P)-dependent dehydrogenase (short-subunit alcohol dehydrogenase family)
MTTRTWFITGISSGFGREIAHRLLERGDRVAGTIRRAGSVDDLAQRYGNMLWVGVADVTDGPALAEVISDAFAALGHIDVIVVNAGYGLFGAVEELTDAQIEHQLDTNLLGSIRTVRAALPRLRAQGGGRIVQLSSIAGLTAGPGASIYHASKWGVEGFAEALVAEVAPFGIGVTIVEPGGARTGFATSGLQLADPMPEYAGTPASGVQFLRGGEVPIPGDPAKMAARVIESVDQDPAPRRIVLGSDAYEAITAGLKERLAEVEPQAATAAQTDAA